MTYRYFAYVDWHEFLLALWEGYRPPMWPVVNDLRLCEGCGKARATQVHHKTYRNLGDEFLFELVALCDACHKRLRAKK